MPYSMSENTCFYCGEVYKTHSILQLEWCLKLKELSNKK